MRSLAKRASISLGLYKPARAIYDAFRPSARRELQEYRKLLSDFVKPGDLAFDVGANIGVRSAVMLSLGAKVVAFEPQPECAKEVRARGNERLTVVEKAVGSSPGFADLHLKKESVQSSLVEGWQGGADVGALRVPLTTLDAEIAQFGVPVFCKIDVEGYEAEVMRGLSHPVRSMSFEYHCDERGVEKLKTIFERLTELGDYEANLNAGEEHEFLISQWLPAGEFIARFPGLAKSFWGDCFVRLRSPA